MVTTTNSNCRQVSFRLKFLIFKENIGIGETKRAESTTVVISKAVEDEVSISNHWLYGLFSPKTNPTIKMALAGVGKPMNEVV